ncbi:MAG: hypothetical protein OSJ67_00645 [Clostridia bacterium]|nr:hypothetical protein [Clostridia bacterium]
MKNIKKFSVQKLYSVGMFAKAGLENIENLFCNFENVAYFEINDDEILSISYYKTSDGWFDSEFFFDTLEEARVFCKEQTKNTEYIKINTKFDAEFYSITKYDEDDEEYYYIDDETYYCDYEPKL